MSDTDSPTETASAAASKLGMAQTWWVVLLCVVVLAVASVAAFYLVLPQELKKTAHPLLYCGVFFMTSFLVNLAAAAVTYLVADRWIRKWREIQNKELADSLVVTPIERRLRVCISESLKEWNAGYIREYESLTQVDWNDVILKAETTIDLCVQGWDGFVNSHSSAWTKFLKKGGQVNLFLPLLPEKIDESATLPHIAKRLDRTLQRQADEISDTNRSLCTLRDECGAGFVNPHWVSSMIWYCLVRVDEKVAYLSPYAHVSSNTKISPAFEIRLDRAQATKHWITREIIGLQAAAIGT